MNDMPEKIWIGTGEEGPEVVSSADIAVLYTRADLFPRWIPVSERLPEEEGRYLIRYTTRWAMKDYVFIGDYLPIEKRWMSLSGGMTVTHWMEIPE